MDAKETFDQFLTLFYLHPTSVWEEPDPDATTAFIPLDNGEHAWLVMPHEDDFHSQIGYDRWFATRNMDGRVIRWRYSDRTIYMPECTIEIENDGTIRVKGMTEEEFDRLYTKITGN